MNRPTFRAAVIVLLLLFWAVSLQGLDVIPPVYEDEGWLASTGWKLATQGVFGSDMFSGFYGMERHYYGFMPLHPLLLALTFKAGGLGLFQARLEPVILGTFTLALTYSLGRRLFEPAVGSLALVLLLFVRSTATTPSQVSGILLVDIARIARYDVAVPMFGLLALHTFWSGRRTRRWYWFAASGLLAALSGLSHLYGLFWMASLLLLALWQRIGRGNVLSMGLGFVLPWLPYGGYVLSGIPDWVGQTRAYAPRFEMLNPGWYWSNIVREAERYAPGLGQGSWRDLLRPGLWTWLAMVPICYVMLAWRTLSSRDRRSAGRQTLLVPAVLFPAAFAALIYLKLSNYLVAVMPLYMLLMAWGGLALWRWRPVRSAPERAQTIKKAWKPQTVLRVGLALLLLVIVAEGTTRLRRLAMVASQTTPYGTFITRVRTDIRPRARVLGLHHYWFGMEEYDYRSWAVPLLQSDPAFWSPPLPIELSLDRLAPDAILVDRRMRAYMTEHPSTAEAIEAWIEGRGFALTRTVEDETYGRVEVYRVSS